MDTYEAKELLANSLRCLAMSMEQIRLRETEKCMGYEEPMQDHLAECTWARHPHDMMSVKDCLEYLGRLYKGFEEASDHEILAGKKFTFAESELANICDMIVGFINHQFPDDLVECAREVNRAAQKQLDANWKHVKSMEHCKQVVAEFLKEADGIIEKHGWKNWKDGEYSLPLGYLGSWMEREYNKQ